MENRARDRRKKQEGTGDIEVVGKCSASGRETNGMESRKRDGQKNPDRGERHRELVGKVSASEGTKVRGRGKKRKEATSGQNGEKQREQDVDVGIVGSIKNERVRRARDVFGLMSVGGGGERSETGGGI